MSNSYMLSDGVEMGEGSSVWRRGIWRAEVENRARELRNRLTMATSLRSHERLAKPRDAFTRKSEVAIKRSLDDAERAIAERRTLPDRVVSWCTGSAITAAWEPIHEAESRLIPLEREEDVRAVLPRLLSWIQHTMPAGPRREGYEEGLRKQIDTGSLDSALIQRAFEDVTAVNGERYANLRGFRNNLILVTAMLAALVGILSLWHLASPEFISFCDDAVAADAAETACFGGASEPRGGDVLLVALFGAIGGLLALAFGLAETKSPPSRYDPRIWQIGLKAAAGSATALAGVVLIQADLVVAPADSPSEALYLAYATIFGFSQQLFTRFVDKRAGELIGSDGNEVEAAAARQA